MIETMIVFNLLYALMLYKNGRRNAAAFSIVFSLLTASLYFANYFLDEFANYLISEYGKDVYYTIVIYFEVLTDVDSLPAAMHMLMLLSIIVSFIFTLQGTILFAVSKAGPLVVNEYDAEESVSSFKSDVRSYSFTFRPATIAHLRI